jgi:hypothetical protein
LQALKRPLGKTAAFKGTAQHFGHRGTNSQQIILCPDFCPDFCPDSWNRLLARCLTGGSIAQWGTCGSWPRRILNITGNWSGISRTLRVDQSNSSPERYAVANKRTQPLAPDESGVLGERHCEHFGRWPQSVRSERDG